MAVTLELLEAIGHEHEFEHTRRYSTEIANQIHVINNRHIETVTTNKKERSTFLSQILSRFREKIQDESKSSKSVNVKTEAEDRLAEANSLLESRQGDRLENIERAISLYQKASLFFTKEKFPVEWAGIQNNLANAYLIRIRGKQVENIERAVNYYQDALTVYNLQNFPTKWASIHKNLASSYLIRPTDNQPATVGKAIDHYQQALKVYTRQAFPENWANIQKNTAEAYATQTQDYEKAINHYQLALEVYDSQAFPKEWADIQNHLGRIYVSREHDDRATNIKKGIQHYERALEIVTREGQPVEWASTMMNLGQIYLEHIREDKAQNIDESINYYKQALEVYARQVFPIEWAQANEKLAAAYQMRLSGNYAQNIEHSINHYQLALTVYTRQDRPTDWAKLHNCLGETYLNYQRGERRDNLKQAIQHFRRALEVYTFEEHKTNWAKTQHNLGLAYAQRPLGEEADYLKTSIKALQNALPVYAYKSTASDFLAEHRPEPTTSPAGQNIEETKQNISFFNTILNLLRPEVNPELYQLTAYMLGADYYDSYQYSEAYQALKQAHQALEILRGQAVHEGAKVDLARRNINLNLYELLIQVCLLLDKPEEAFEYAVAGKGRAFVDKLAATSIDLSLIERENPDFAIEFKQAHQLRKQIESKEEEIEKSAPHSDQEQIRQAQAELIAEENALWQKMAQDHPILTATQSVPSISHKQATQLSTELGATLVEFYRHAWSWSAFIVTHDDVKHVRLDLLNDKLIKELLKWRRRIEYPTRIGRTNQRLKPLDDLHQAVILPLQKHLPKDKPIILAPFGQLHLLPLAAARNSEGRYFAETCTLAFVPSLTALYVADQQVQKSKGLEISSKEKPLLSVAYPGEGDNYLHNVSREAQYIAQLFQPSELIQGEDATPQEIIAKARDRRILHLSCHGEFDRQEPEQSGLMLAKERLTIRDIITKLHLKQTELVTLAACRSGQVAVRKGEEHVGLLQAMMTAGAKSVVASLWRVDDEATSELFVSFYDNIADGHSPAIAIHQAAQKVRQNPRTTHPYYWAAFQVNGLGYQPITTGLIRQATQDKEAIASRIQRSKGDQSMDLASLVDSAEMLLEDMKDYHNDAMDILTQEQQAEVAKALVELTQKAMELKTEDELWDVAYKLHRLVEEYPDLVEEHPEGMDIQRDGKKGLAETAQQFMAFSHVQQRQPQLESSLDSLQELASTSAGPNQLNNTNRSGSFILQCITILLSLFSQPN